MNKLYLVLKRRLLNFIEEPNFTIVKLIMCFANAQIIPDKMYLKYLFYAILGYPLNLKNPKTFNEKLQWLKLYDRNPLYSIIVDKVKVKDWVAYKIGYEYIIPTYATYKSAEDINTDNYPSRFVLKCNHDSSSVVVIKNKDNFDIEFAKNKLQNALNHNYYWYSREWPYKNVSPLILAEQYIGDGTEDLVDYKVLCFNGIPKLIQVHKNRHHVNHTQDFYDTSWNKIPNLRQLDCPNSNNSINKPSCLEKMLKLSAVLSEGIPHVRVDWYIVDEKLYFGEMTFYDSSGFDDFYPREYNQILGDWIHLPRKKNN